MSKKIDIHWIVFGVAGGVLFYLLLWWIFDDFAGQAADHLRNLIFLIGGITAAIIAAWRAQVADEQAKTADEQAKTESKKADIAERTQITDRFARALEQLNNDNIYMRIGAIQALERIGYDSEENVLGVLRLLAGFVREQCPVENESVDTVQPDVQESAGLDAEEGLEAIGRLAGHYKEFLKGDDAFRLNLSASNLIPFPAMNRGHFCGFRFNHSNIEYQVFEQSDFEKASFFGTDLTSSLFLNCNFIHVSFMRAILDSAKFYNADMSNAELHWATCNNTDFSTAKNLTTEMLKDIIYDAETPPKVPKGVTLPPPREKQSGDGK